MGDAVHASHLMGMKVSYAIMMLLFIPVNNCYSHGENIN